MIPSRETTNRVVHVSFGLQVGGQEKLLVEFARHSDRSRFALTFVSLGGRGELAADLEDCGSTVVALGQPSGLKPSLILRLASLFRSSGPHVVHTHDTRSLLYAGPAARLARVPLIVHTCHGHDLRATCRQHALMRAASRLVDRYVCVSEVVKAQSRELGVSERRMCTILNGIDTGRFCYTGAASDGPVVTVARLSPEKDIASLLHAAALAAPQADDLRIEVAGAGTCRDELRRRAAELNVADRVLFLGEVRDVPPLLARASIFVLPSLSEGIPLTVLEAMASGLPVVATSVGGVPEVVMDGRTGLLVPPSNPAALAQAIRALWGDPERRVAMGKAGRKRVEESFDIRRMIADYEALYLDLGPPELRARALARANRTGRAKIESHTEKA